jgi:hypothetical protein
MSLAEGVQARIAYKAHSTGVITPGTSPDLSTDPGATGAQTLRRVSSSLNLTKTTYQSGEIRSDRQIADYRHGPRKVEGSVSGELSALTYQDFFEASTRGTWAAAITASESDFTSAAFDADASTVTFASGNPVTKGFRIGDLMRFANLATAGNNATNFLITGFGGTTNETVSIYPAPTTETADTAFTVTAFKSLEIPSSGFVSRLFAIEEYSSDVDIARVFSECRIGGFNLKIPATGMATIEFPLMGRDMTSYESGSAPFFTSPTDVTTTNVMASVNGLLRVGGTNVAVVTGLDMSLNLSPSSDPVAGSNLVPEIFLGRANLTGNITAFFENLTLVNDFTDETEIDLLVYLTGSSDAGAQAMTFYLPRLKFGAADLPLQGEAGQTITLPFQALLYQGSAAGVPLTTLRIVDTEAT